MKLLYVLMFLVSSVSWSDDTIFPTGSVQTGYMHYQSSQEVGNVAVLSIDTKFYEKKLTKTLGMVILPMKVTLIMDKSLDVTVYDAKLGLMKFMLDPGYSAQVVSYIQTWHYRNYGTFKGVEFIGLTYEKVFVDNDKLQVTFDITARAGYGKFSTSATSSSLVGVNAVLDIKIAKTLLVELFGSTDLYSGATFAESPFTSNFLNNTVGLTVKKDLNKWFSLFGTAQQISYIGLGTKDNYAVYNGVIGVEFRW